MQAQFPQPKSAQKGEKKSTLGNFTEKLSIITA